jgi:histidinol-phosphate/aromatic aminotransferase/cobyric acid decarboxylase-like protein
MALEFAQRINRIPVYPAADGYASEGPIAKLASNESPYPPLPAVVEAAAAALAESDRSWLERLITRRVPLDRWDEALQREEHDIKVVVELGA